VNGVSINLPSSTEIEQEHTVSDNDLVLPPNYPLQLSLVVSKRMSCVIISGGVKKKQSTRVVDEFSWEKEHNMPQTERKIFAYL
jgi:hypothetical protein